MSNHSPFRSGRTGRRLAPIAAAATLLTSSAAFAAGGPTSPPPHAGVIPQGVWVLNQGRSQKLDPGSQILWIVKDDGDHSIWVSVERDAQQRVRVSSWDGRYDGKPVTVAGTGMVAHVVSAKPGSVHNWGEIPGVGSYSEDCAVLAAGKRLRCEGEVHMTGGVKHYVDDFDWRSEGPI